MNRYLYPTFHRPPRVFPQPGQLWQRKDKAYPARKLLRFEEPDADYAQGRWMLSETSWVVPVFLEQAYEPI